MIHYPTRRVLALFHAHEALPHHPKFVLETVKPLVEAELNAWFCQAEVIWKGLHDLERFAHDIECEYRDRVMRRDISAVQDFRFLWPKQRTLPYDFQLQYSLMFRPLDIHVLRVKVDHRSHAERDALLDVAHNKISHAVAVITATPTQMKG